MCITDDSPWFQSNPPPSHHAVKATRVRVHSKVVLSPPDFTPRPDARRYRRKTVVRQGGQPGLDAEAPTPRWGKQPSQLTPQPRYYICHIGPGIPSGAECPGARRARRPRRPGGQAAGPPRLWRAGGGGSSSLLNYQSDTDSQSAPQFACLNIARTYHREPSRRLRSAARALSSFRAPRIGPYTRFSRAHRCGSCIDIAHPPVSRLTTW